MSRPFVEKTLKNPPQWLRTRYFGRDEGWELTVNLAVELTQRASKLVEGGRVELTTQLCKPESIEDGQRNHWITKACLLLKHNGTDELVALRLMKKHVKLIPGNESSSNCKNVSKIVKSIYGNFSDLVGIRPGCAPAWLLQGFDLVRKMTLASIR